MKKQNTPREWASDEEQNRTEQNIIQIGRALHRAMSKHDPVHTWARTTKHCTNTEQNSWGISKEGCAWAVCYLSSCVSCVSLRKRWDLVCDGSDQTSSFMCAFVVCYIEDCMKYVVASSLYAAHHPPIHHVQAVKSHLSNPASCRCIHLWIGLHQKDKFPT